MYSNKKVYNFEVADWHTYFVGAWEWLVHNAQPCLTTMMRESQRWFQNIMRGRSFNNVMNAFTEEFAKLAGKKFFPEAYLKLAKGGTKSGKGFVDAVIDGVGLERKATDVLKVTEQTLKSYIRDASKYAGGRMLNPPKVKLADEVILQVEKNADKITEGMKEYAKKYNVKIVDNIDDAMKAVENILLK